MNTKTTLRQHGAAGLMALAAGLASTSVSAQAVKDLPGGPGVNQLDLTRGVTQLTAHLQDLHHILLVLCLVIFIAVFGVMFYSILKHRKSVGHKSANFHESVSVEIAWTVIPFIIVIGMGALATRAVVAQKDTSNADITIKATGIKGLGWVYVWGRKRTPAPATGITTFIIIKYSSVVICASLQRRPQRL